MEKDSKYIVNRIGEYRRDDILEFCYKLMDSKRNEMFPIWHVFLIMKWAYLYSGIKYSSKVLTPERFARIYNAVNDLGSEHVTSFFTNGRFDRSFAILFSQQFYLQKPVRLEVFAMQMKIYNSISGKYDINGSFKNMTGLSITDFIFLLELLWLFLNRDILNFGNENVFYNTDFISYAKGVINETKIIRFLDQLLLDPTNPIGKISEFKRGIRNSELQPFETTFFTMFPLHLFKGEVRLIHKLLFNHTANYFIHDFLKVNDPLFNAEFGRRFEKYIGLGLKEMNCNCKTENTLKVELPPNSKLVDYYLPDTNIYIECKSIEMTALPSYNPTDDLLFNALKDSILKAYFDQILTVAKEIGSSKENWGLIITYKEFFWSEMTDLFELGKGKFENFEIASICKPENVFIVDIYTWDRIVGLVKEGSVSLLEILTAAKTNNSNPQTKKALFRMHLDEYKYNTPKLSYLESEVKELTSSGI
jgi:hypothetical protein